MRAKETCEILIIEDRVARSARIEEALRRRKIRNPIHVANTQREAMELVGNTGTPPRCRKPFIALVDLSGPGEASLDFLKRLRADPRCKDQPVVAIGRPGPGDAALVEELGIQACIPERDYARGFFEAIRRLNGSWRVVVEDR